MLSFGDRVKQRRLELGMTQDDLAYKMGYSGKHTISKIENGRDCSIKLVKRIAEALDCTAADLLGLNDRDSVLADTMVMLQDLSLDKLKLIQEIIEMSDKELTALEPMIALIKSNRK